MPAYVLADNVPDAVRQWQGSSIALAKADPSAVVLVSDDVIGAPPRGPALMPPAPPTPPSQSANTADLGLMPRRTGADLVSGIDCLG